MANKIFYTKQDFLNLIEEIVNTETFRIEALITHHMKNSNEQAVNWLNALRSNILKLEFIEPKNIKEHSYTTNEKSRKNPDQINYAFLIIEKKHIKELKKVQLRANPELFRKTEDLSKTDYKNICKRIERCKNQKGQTQSEELSEAQLANLKLLETELKLLEIRKRGYENLHPKTQKPNKEKPTESRKHYKKFPEYLIHPTRGLLAKRIKSEFSTEYGKGIRLLIEALISKQILTIENRQRTAVHNALKKYLNREIGTYQSIFVYAKELVTCGLDFEAIDKKLGFILESIDSAD